MGFITWCCTGDDDGFSLHVFGALAHAAGDFGVESEQSCANDRNTDYRSQQF